MRMTPTEFKQCRHILGLTQSELARLLRLRPGGDRSIRHYEQGTKPVPGPISVVLDILTNLHEVEHLLHVKELAWQVAEWHRLYSLPGRRMSDADWQKELDERIRRLGRVVGESYGVELPPEPAS